MYFQKYSNSNLVAVGKIRIGSKCVYTIHENLGQNSSVVQQLERLKNLLTKVYNVNIRIPNI